MTDELTDARAELRTLLRIVSSMGTSNPTLIERCRPLLEPSDAERKFDEIRAVIEHCLPHDLTVTGIRAILDPPLRVPQVGDTVRLRHHLSGDTNSELVGVQGYWAWVLHEGAPQPLTYLLDDVEVVE